MKYKKESTLHFNLIKKKKINNMNISKESQMNMNNSLWSTMKLLKKKSKLNKINNYKETIDLDWNF